MPFVMLKTELMIGLFLNKLLSLMLSLVRIPLESLLFLMVALVWQRVLATWWV
ncbi:unnamed protein product [Camellia sinensis]